ncbi:uncharacterized protein LOC132546646 [Ylistrum balloti]|uniref:uncharacterized protein LOC132546646 n=1 Tax=Ylistrum balloti TaxID=509963 RepID=UPI002905F1C6|nr:uncharacterized protein LOC132546646 [Ylistrum balloti]
MTSELWFGLHTDVGASCDMVQYQWDDGEPLGSWSDWYVGSYTEPNSCSSDLCIRISSSKWKTISCSNQYGFVCEYLGGTCGFETVTDKTFTRGPDSSDIPDVQNIFTRIESTNNLATCLEACQMSSIGNLDCWFVVTNISNADVCYLYYTSDKYLADRPQNTTVTTGLSIHVKRCGNVAVYGETTSSTSAATTTTTCVALTTVEASTTSTTQPTTTLTTTQQHTSSVLTTTVGVQTTNSVECLKYSNQTITYTFAELQEQVKKLKAELMVIKNSTNRYMRTLISVYDGRASAVSVGVIGAFFLGVIPVLFFIADMPVLYRHSTGRWGDCSNQNNCDGI